MYCDGRSILGVHRWVFVSNGRWGAKMNVAAARKLVIDADVNFKELTARIDKKIQEVATLGKEELDVGSVVYDLQITSTVPSYRTTDDLAPKKKELVERLITHYVKNGFSAAYGPKGPKFIPRAYEDDANAQTYYTWSLIIGWK